MRIVLPIGFLLLALVVGCGGSSDDKRAAASSGTAVQGLEPSEAARMVEFLEGAREMDLGLGAAQKTDYAAIQKTIQASFLAEEPELGSPKVVRSGDWTVTTVEELRSALGRAAPGQVVFIEAGAILDLTGTPSIRVPRGVTVASYRDPPASEGALLYTNDLGAKLFLAGDEVAFNGLNLMGPDPTTRTYQLERLAMKGGSDLYYAVPAATGILCEAKDVAIENCEIWGWGFAGVAFRGGARGTVRHCFIHHNQRRGLGYGVYVDEAVVKIEVNLFDWCRHCVSASGKPETGYEARYNFVLMNTSGHAFDMHGGADRDDGTDIAGSWAWIHHNTVEAAQFPGVVIRGTPIDQIRIYNNRFRNPDPTRTIMLLKGPERIEVTANQFGVTSIQQKQR